MIAWWVAFRRFLHRSLHGENPHFCAAATNGSVERRSHCVRHGDSISSEMPAVIDKYKTKSRFLKRTRII